jgi:Domain of unknown function (DUF4365)
MRKRRTREHVIADLSVNHVERLVLRCGWTVERVQHDYGIDLLMRTYGPTGEVKNDEIGLQLKATDSLPLSAGRRTIPLRLEWRDLLFWLNEAIPIILIVYDAAGDRAYWLNVQAHFRGRRWARRTGGTATVHVPADNVLDEAAVRLFARFRDEYRAARGE